MEQLSTKYFICVFLSYFKSMKSKRSLFLILSFLLLISAVTGAAALSYTIGSQVNVSNNAGVSETPQIKTSGSNVFVVWKDITSGTNNILFKKSTNDGTSFGSAITLDSGSANSQDPQMAFSGANIYSVWHEGSPSVIAFAKSSDTGGTFGAQVILSSATATSVLPQINASSSNVYVTWQQDTDIYYTNSTDSGATFGTAIPLESGAPSSSSPEIATDGNNIYVIWKQDNDISFIRSNDNGDTFESSASLSTSGSASRPAIAASASKVYVVWQDSSNMIFRKSTNSGASFGSEIILGAHGVTSSTNTAPEIMVSGNNVYVTWRQNSTGEIYFARSTDGGDTFQTAVNLSSNSGSSILPHMAVLGNTVVVVWRDSTPGNTEIFYSASDDSGVTFGNPANISNTSANSETPSLAVTSSKAYFVWNDSTSGNQDIWFVSGTPSPTTVSFDTTQYTLNDSADITVTVPSKVNSISSEVISVNVKSDTDSTGIDVSFTENADTGIFTNTISFDSIASSSLTKELLASAGDTITATYSSTTGTASVFPITITVKKSGIAFLEFDYGDIVNVQVDDPNSNEDPLAIDTIQVSITSTRDPSGITLDLAETGINTGIFGGSASTLIFTDGNTQISSTGTMTVSHTDSSANTDISAIDLSQVTVTSTSDSIGIPFDLVETGINTGQFQKTLSMSTTSISNSAIQVAGGDILSITSGFFTSNALVTPNADSAKGAISVDFTNDDTVIVSYLAESHSVTAKDSAGPGGGGGGLVRPGLVINALAGFGGGSSASAPSIYLTDLVSSSAIDLPPELEQIILAHNSAVPIPPMKLDSFGDFDFPLVLNDKGFVLGGFTNTLETQTLKTNTPVIMKFTVYEAEKIQHFSLYTNLMGDNVAIPQSDTKILYNDGKELQVIDPQGFFADAKITVSEIDSVKKQVLVEITFAKPMDTSNVIIRSWDSRLHSRDMHILDAIKIESDEPKSNPLPQNPAPEIEELKSQSIPMWVKNNAGWWSEQQIDDQDFVAGIQYMINHGIITIPSTETVNSETTIPHWIKNNAGWWASHQISDDDFVKAMEWLVTNGVITVK
jgi:hypothetical protein